jgi:hypothetical protein
MLVRQDLYKYIRRLKSKNTRRRKTGIKITNTYGKTKRHERYDECGHNILGVWHAMGG